MKLIGLTGGIGSGKTTVAQIFKTLGVPVLNADEQGRWLLANDMGVIDAVKNLFGEEVYVNGQPDRQAIAGRVFKDADLLERLNAIIHPAVRRRSDEWANSLPTDTAYALREAAILFESGANEQCVEVIAVHAPMDVRMQRILARDKSKEEEVKARMDKQWPQEKVMESSDHLIDNGGERSVIQQVLALHRTLSS